MSRPMPLLRASLCLLLGATVAEAQPRPRAVSPDARSDVRTDMLVGTVVDAIGRPMADVEVYLARTERSTRTDARGVWRVLNPPVGAHVVVARQFGYVPYMREVIIGTGTPDSVDLLLRRYPTTLSPVEVRARSNRSAAEADVVADRLTQLKANAGRLFTRAQILEQKPYSLAELIQGVPGILVRRGQGEIVATSLRGGAAIGGGGGSQCELQFFLDITPLDNAGAASIDPLSVRSVEVYPQNVLLPGLPQRADKCGFIVVNSLRR
ncbi:carboxypeptidase-like regulatory domain-containing protein [Gemmatimonas sp.]|uniref:carboxypeptidase-like regulatory domain-containing protein n=1 Tax=Gemmatimonas sp. TaxID=1962908 RepID=UPI0025B9B813|nr:carboxypeptidase-like regulatory domain-containing protein [Gemmatimonas sp.]MCA2983134.1 carboxypeptidase regulatory-like domain-containing protein [Gemmatimonas sp.]MCA2986145.1 carboxypeptidase regulatory-like domain-containing protein [Gemmatimonas sp.]MCA2993744.1 carboxypeptidase regulatory-like domain-containing protein [Gemmatimonas sp.]